MSLRLGQMDGQNPIELRPLTKVVYRSVQFSRDASSIYYVIEDTPLNTRTLYRIPVRGGVPVKLRENVGSYVTISPKDGRIAFARNTPDSKTRSSIAHPLPALHLHPGDRVVRALGNSHLG